MQNLFQTSKVLIVFVLLFFQYSVLGSAEKSIDEEEIVCLAHNIYYEARGESNRGKIAVANVTMNRVKEKGYPSSVCGVVSQKNKNVCQFSWFCKTNLPKIKDEIFAEIRHLAEKVYKGEVKDNTKGATHFHSNAIEPEWSKKKVMTVQIGNHTFYRK